MPRGPISGGVLALAAAVLLLTVQPIRERWWHWADPDGAYVGSSLNILVGNHTNYLDHPGLPTQDALALAFGANYLVDKARGEHDSRQAFVDDRMLDLDQTRVLYRGWAIALLLGGTLLVYLVVGRLLGHWTWGLAGSLLFLSAPGLAEISFLLRPDTAVAALCLGVGYLTVTAFTGRSALRYAAAGVVLGLAVTMKLTAIAMALPLTVAALWRPPGAGWFREGANAVTSWTRRNVLWLVPVVLVWLVLCYLFNRERLPIVQTDDQRSILINGATFLVGYTILAFVTERFRIPWADRIFRLSYACILLAFVVGLAIPASLVLDDGVQMLVAIKETLTGGRVNEDVEPFENFTWSSLRRSPLNYAVVVIGLGAVAGVFGLVRRHAEWPFLLALGSLALATMAAARYSYDYYYAPAFAVAIPGALWLVRRPSRVAVPVYVAVPVLALYLWTLSDAQSWEQRHETAVDASAQELADELLQPGEVALVPSYYYPIEDVRFDSLVEGFVDHVPDFPYRFLSSPGTAAAHGLTPAYYVAPYADLPPARTSITIAGQGPYVIEKLPTRWGPADEYGVARIISAPALEP